VIILCYVADRVPFKKTKCGFKYTVMGFHSGVGRRNLILPDLMRKGATKSELAVLWLLNILESLRIERYLEGREETDNVMREKRTYNCLNLCYPVDSVQT